jgi:type II secretory pathway component PulF
MPKFAYRAITPSGNTVSSVIEADSPETAALGLAERGLIPQKVTEKAKGSPGISLDRIKERLTPIKARDLILFTKQLRTMIKAGVLILTILQVLENQTENIRLKRIVSAIALDIKEGTTLYDAFQKHANVFSPLYCGMIRAGESSGSLPAVIDRMIYILEHEHKIKSDIKSALQYPMIVVVFLGIAFFVLLTFVIPKFASIFLRAGLDLPLPTKICLAMHHALTAYWFLIIGGVMSGIVFLIYYFKTDPGRYVRDSLFIRIPIIGPLFLKAAMSRFASIFAILHTSGVPVLQSLTILTGTMGNAAISREFDQIKEKIEAGQGISEPLKSARYFTPMVINMVSIGEESGRLDEMLRDISAHYDDEVDYAMKRLSDAIGPALTIGLAAVVGFFALAIFLPMWDLTGMVK